MYVGDTPVAEDPSILGKRKWSPGDSVGEPIPGLSIHDPITEDISSHLDPISGDSSSTNKKLRLPPKPPLPSEDAVKPQTHLLIASLTDLPPEIVQHVLSFVDPLSLGRLIRTNKLFQTLLDSRKPLPQATENVKHLSLRSQDSIWSLSRRRWIPSMPRPLNDLDEYDTIKLVFGKNCQFCGRRPIESFGTGSYPWERGPGSESVRLIWPFKIRSCSSCLQSRIKTDAEVFLSPASPLIPGLPFALFTSSFDFVPPTILRHSSIPPGVKVTKYFYCPQIDSLHFDARESRAFGQAAAEEWFKGLEPRLQEHTADTARFEQWEASGGLDSALVDLGSSVNLVHNPPISASADRARSTIPVETFAETSSFHAPFSSLGLGRLTSPISLPGSLPLMPMHQVGLAPGQDILRGIQQTASSDSASQGSQRGSRSQRPSKSAREIQKLKLERRYEIEKRCRGLDPPIYPEMLERLDAFVAAIQIPMPLNENAWETLKRRLITQRKGVDVNDEARNSVVIPPIPGQFKPQDQSDEYWLVHAQKSIREKLCEYAEEYIKQRWGHGTWVTYANAPQFAAEVLQHTRNRYYEVQNLELESQIRNDPRNPTHPLTDAEDQTLKLEHMKWVFDQTIKPRTELIRKDLFLCNECNISGNRHFGFDSVIQHYASKHTSDLSRGQAVVYWKAEWPDNPPFNPHPERVSVGSTNLAQTPTLEDIPYSNTSPNSVKTPRVRSVGNRSPGTISLTSNQASTVFGKQPSAPWPSTTIGGPGVGIYHLQCDEAADEAGRAWEELARLPDIPDSLRAYMVIQQVVQGFTRKYKNEPSVSMFLDCLRNKMELQPLNDLSAIQCKGCALASLSNLTAQASVSTIYSLGDLLDHFQKAHLEQDYSSARLNWKYEMILLPPASTIRALMDKPGIEDATQNLLKDALITAISDGDLLVQHEAEKSDPEPRAALQPAFHPHRDHIPSPRPLVHGIGRMVPFEQKPVEGYSPRHPHFLPVNREIYDPGLVNATVSNTPPYTYEEMEPAEYPRRPLSRSRNSPSVEAALPHFRERSMSGQRPIRPVPDLSEYPQDHVLHSPHVSVPMVRTDTKRSQAASGRGSIRAGSVHGSNPAEVFLRNFDSLADDAIEHSSAKAGSSIRGSKTQSLSGSQVELPPTSRPVLHDGPTSAGRRSRNLFEPPEATGDDQMEPISPHRLHEYRSLYEGHPNTYNVPISPRERGLSQNGRYVDYEQRGYPTERHYREISPVNYTRPRQYIDERGRRIEVSPPGYGLVTYREALPDRPFYVDESGRPIEPGYGPGQPVEYIRHHAPRPIRQEAFYDHATGRYYIERPVPVREYIELEDRYRPPVYREIPGERSAQQDERSYERYPSDPYDDDRYPGRR